MATDYINIVTINEVKRIFNFCNLDVNSQTKEFIKGSNSSKNKKTYSVYRERVNDNDWIRNLDISIRYMIRSNLEESNIMDFKI